MTVTARVLLAVMLVACFTCRAEPATSPTNKAVVICFNGKLNSGSYCSGTCFQPDGTLHPTGKMTCGWPGKVSEIEWRFVRRNGTADVYEFTRMFPIDTDKTKTEKKTVEFNSEKVIVFEDAFQVIVIQIPKARDTDKPSVGGDGKPAPLP